MAALRRGVTPTVVRRAAAFCRDGGTWEPRTPPDPFPDPPVPPVLGPLLFSLPSPLFAPAMLARIAATRPPGGLLCSSLSFAGVLIGMDGGRAYASAAARSAAR